MMGDMFKTIIEDAIEDGHKVNIKSHGKEEIILPYDIYNDLVIGYDIGGHIQSFVLEDIDNVTIVEW